MSASNSSAVAEMLARVRRLAPLVAEHRQAIDRERRLPDAVFEACADAGLFRLWLSKTLDGPELTPLEFMGVVEAAAGLDGSIGWIVGNGGGMSRVAGYLPAPVARDWFSNPHAFLASATGAVGTALPVKGGYRVTGRWPFGSGAHHATRFMGLCSVGDASSGEPSRICCYFAREHVTIVDNWHVSGLRGTGSCDFEVRDLPVPPEHTHSFPDHQATQPGLIYRMPAMSVFAWTVSVVPLGIARAAMDAFAALAIAKMRSGTSAPLRDREIIQSEFGRADAQLRAGRAFLGDAMSELMAATDVGGERLVRARASLRAACSHAAESAVEIVERLSAAAGAVAIFETSPLELETSPLERCIRDVQAAVKHVAMSPGNYVVSGRLGLGLAPGTARF